jgi:hypothetical protein
VSLTEINAEQWFGNPDLVPAADIAAAEAALAANDAATFAWRIKNYRLWRTGFNAATGAWRTQFMYDHDTAVALALKHCACIHDFERTTSFDNTNHVLGTFDRGYVQTCTKCGYDEHVRTSWNNRSGD